MTSPSPLRGSRDPLSQPLPSVLVPAGGMQDYNYVWAGCLEVTLEVSCCKFPPPQQLPALWSANRGALLAFIRQVHLGQYLSVPQGPAGRGRPGVTPLSVCRGQRSGVRRLRPAGSERGGGGQRSQQHVSVPQR